MKKYFLLALAGVILFTHLETFFLPVGTDEGMFYHIGQQISQGFLPYRDVWEHKPPVAFYIFAAVLKISNTNAALLILELFWVFTTAYFLYLLARFFLKEEQARYAGLLYAFLGNLHRFTQGGNQTEVYMVLFIILTYYFFMRYRDENRSSYLFWSGVMWGIGFQTKPVALFSGAAVGIFLLYEFITARKKDFAKFMGQAAVYALGFIVPNALLLSYFVYLGILPDFLKLNYGYNVMYVTRNNTSSMRLGWLKDTLVDNLISIAFAWVLIAVAWLRLPKLFKDKKMVFLYIVFVMDFLGVCLGGKFHGHYWLQLMPVVAIISVLIYISLPKRSITKTLVQILFVLAVLAQIFFSSKIIYKKLVLNTPDYDKQTVYYLRTHMAKTDRVYVQGLKPSIYFHADRPIAWNVETDNILRRLSAAEQKQYELTMKRVMPKYIVLTEKDVMFAWQPAFIAQKYRLEKIIGIYKIYVKQ